MKTKLLTVLSAVLLCSAFTADVYAGQLAQCEKRTTPARSKISVQVEKVRPHAMYTAIVKSGAKSYSSIKTADALGKVKFAFDSNRKDILAGKKAIPAKFIAFDIDVWVYDALGKLIAKKPDTACTIR